MLFSCFVFRSHIHRQYFFLMDILYKFYISGLNILLILKLSSNNCKVSTETTGFIPMFLSFLILKHMHNNQSKYSPSSAVLIPFVLKPSKPFYLNITYIQWMATLILRVQILAITSKIFYCLKIFYSKIFCNQYEIDKSYHI